MTEVVRITRRIEIDMGHRVPDTKSKCRSIHGHRYRIEAEVEGEVYSRGEQTGMVMDFGFLKEAMMNGIHRDFDHALVMFHKDPLLDDIMDALMEHRQRIIPFLLVPTAENLAKFWFGCIYEEMRHMDWNHPGTTTTKMPKLTAVTVWETPNCTATYRP